MLRMIGPGVVWVAALQRKLDAGDLQPAGIQSRARPWKCCRVNQRIVDTHRGHGLSKWLMEIVVAHPELQGLRRFLLNTRDAHGLYRQFGFTALGAPEWTMERFDPDVYRRETTRGG